METRDMVRMANQISTFFKTYPREEALHDTAAHISNFWDPRMRRMLFQHLDKGGEGLDPFFLNRGSQANPPANRLGSEKQKPG